MRSFNFRDWRRLRFFLLAGVVIGLAVAGGEKALAQAKQRERAETAPSGLILPRFVSLATDKAYMRTGPGQRYPILWVYRLEDWPFEVTAEYGPWRKLSDPDGVVGWMHVNLLSGRRTGVITGEVRTLYDRADRDSRPVLRAEPGVIVTVEQCEDAWCQVRMAGRKAWLPRDHFWGTYKGERIR